MLNRVINKAVILTTLVLPITTAASSPGKVELRGHFIPQSTWLISRTGFNDVAGIEYQATWGKAVGFSLTYYWTDNLGLGAGILNSYQGQQYRLDPEALQDNCLHWGQPLTFQVNLRYKKIPIFLEYRTLTLKKLSYSFFAGVQICLLAYANDNYQDLLACYILIPPPEKRYDKIDNSAILGASVQYRLSTHLSLRSQICIDIGLTDAFVSEPENAYVFYRSLQYFRNSVNMTIGWGLGIAYGF